MSRSRHYLAEFELLVMLAVLRQGGDAYGASIRREIEERTGRPVSIGAVYATLGRLGDKGLMEASLSEPLPVKGGRSRKLYRLTAAGRRAVRNSALVLTRMLDGVELVAENRGGKR